MKQEYKKAIIAGVIYFCLFLLSYAYFLARYEHDKFSGIFLVIVTAPWTPLISLARLKFGIETELSFVAINVLMWASAIINFFAIVLITRKLNKANYDASGPNKMNRR